jgi:hypothetical protein
MVEISSHVKHKINADKKYQLHHSTRLVRIIRWKKKSIDNILKCLNITGLNCKVDRMVDLIGLGSKTLVYAKRVNRLEVRMTLE